MKYEIVEKSTGHRMAHTKSGEVMSTTLFDTMPEAVTWRDEKGLSAGKYDILPAKV